MLKNALLYADQVKTKFLETWYDPKYQYYYGQHQRWIYGGEADHKSWVRQFVSVDKNDNVIGFFSYTMDLDTMLAYDFEIINFTDNPYTFSRDLYHLFDDIFLKHGFRTIECRVLCGNPIEKSYDRMFRRLGGRILCQRTSRAKTMNGQLVDDKLYELTWEQYDAYRASRPRSSTKNGESL